MCRAIADYRFSDSAAGFDIEAANYNHFEMAESLGNPWTLGA
jgi:hypothetical protein